MPRNVPGENNGSVKKGRMSQQFSSSFVPLDIKCMVGIKSKRSAFGVGLVGGRGMALSL